MPYSLERDILLLFAALLLDDELLFLGCDWDFKFEFEPIGDVSLDKRFPISLNGDLDLFGLGAILFRREDNGFAVPDDELAD